MADEIAILKNQGASEFYFADSNFIGPGKKGRERALTLAGLIRPLNITFGMETRPDDLENNFRFLEKNRLLDRLERTANLLCHRQIVLMRTLGYHEFIRQERLIPSGPLGFQGDVAYQDYRVRWMSELFPHACLSVLRQISSADSPLYWKTCGDEKLCARVNHYLVELFQHLLKQASEEKLLPPVGRMKQEIE